MPKNRPINFLAQDFVIIAISVVFAVMLGKTYILGGILTASQSSELIGSFISGMFFTSIFTTAPAIVALGEIGQKFPVIQVAIMGGLGAVVGDLLIFKFVKDRFSTHVTALIELEGGMKRMGHLFKLPFFKWLTFLIGGLIIASPLPDELGVALLGFSRLKAGLFIPLSFICNSLGIYLIATAARAIR